MTTRQIFRAITATAMAVCLALALIAHAATTGTAGISAFAWVVIGLIFLAVFHIAETVAP